MSFREVTSLRKAGQLDEALAIAREDYAYVVDSYSASALFWTLKVVCERSIAQGDMEGATEFISQMEVVYPHVSDGEGIAARSLGTLKTKASPEHSLVSEALKEAKNGNPSRAYSAISSTDLSGAPMRVREDAAWVSFYHLRARIDVADENEFNSIVSWYYSLNASKPSLCHSQMLNLALKFAGIHQDFDLVSFISDWGVDNFRIEDLEGQAGIAGGLSLRDRTVRRCFLNRSVKLSEVATLFDGQVSEEAVSAILSKAYCGILYQDSVEKKDKQAFFKDADEYVTRIEGVSVRNASHSKILESVIWELDDNHTTWFMSCFEKWGKNASFMSEDMRKVSKDGKQMPSLAERAISRYCDAIEKSNAMDANAYIGFLKSCLPILGNDENLERRLARATFKSGDTEGATKVTLDLIKTHAGKYYFWYDLAEFVAKQDRDLCMACCAKALVSCGEEKYLGKIHLTMGSLLQAKGMYGEALHEIESYRKTCQENGWIVRNEYDKIKSLIPTGISEAKDNRSLYRRLEQAADDFVYSDIASHVMVLCEKGEEMKFNGKKRTMFYLYDNAHRRFRVNPKAFGLDWKSALMSCFSVKYINEDGKTRIVSVKPCEKCDVLGYHQAVVLKVNDEKHSYHVAGMGFETGIRAEKCEGKFKIGDVIEVALSSKEKEGHDIYLCLHARHSVSPCDFLEKEFGKLSVKSSPNGEFGFVGNAYVHKSLLKGFSDGDMVDIEFITLNGKKRVIAIWHTNRLY